MSAINININLTADDPLTEAVAEEIRQHLIRQYADIMPRDPAVNVTLGSWAPERPTETADLPPMDEFAGSHPTPEEDDDV